MKIIISELQNTGQWERVEKILPYNKEQYQYYCSLPELISIEIIG